MKKILIIEDEKSLSDMYGARFTKEGYAVVTAKTAQQGFEMAKAEHPDFILLDILLLDSTGITFLQYRDDDTEVSKIPVLAFSAYDNPETKKQARELGVLDYVIKTDYTPDQLTEKVQEYLTE